MWVNWYFATVCNRPFTKSTSYIMWLVEDQACAHSKETQFVPLDHWWMIQGSCRVLSYWMESRITLPAAFQHTVWLPNGTIGREDIPTCDTGLMEMLTVSTQQKLKVCYLPSYSPLFIESSFVDWCSRIFILKGVGKQHEKGTENVSWGPALFMWAPICF